MKLAYKYLSTFLCLLMLAGLLCSCGKESEPIFQSESEKDVIEESETNSEGKAESKLLKVYDNGVHTFAVWDYDKESEIMTVVFDETKIVYSYYTFEDMSWSESTYMYGGSSDKEFGCMMQFEYNHVDDSYSILLGDDDSILLYGGEDFSGEYTFNQEKEITIDQATLSSPLKYEAVEREQSRPDSEMIESRANGVWTHTVSITDAITLKLYADDRFELLSISAGEVKEIITGTYSIVSDDGTYQEFEFINSSDSADKWTAKIWQTDLTDDYDVSYTGIVYINAEGETLYFTGQKWQ